MSNFKVGDKFECVYPFHMESYHSIQNGMDGIDECWRMGCKKTTEMYDQYCGETFFNADAEGKIIFEVLAVFEMPRSYKDRVIYRFDTIDPDGKEKVRAKDYTVTADKFARMIENPYGHEYEVICE